MIASSIQDSNKHSIVLPSHSRDFSLQRILSASQHLPFGKGTSTSKAIVELRWRFKEILGDGLDGLRSLGMIQGFGGTTLI